MKQQYQAITLIEMVVVLTIIAILAVVAFPSYQTYLIESRRSDAIVGLRNNQLLIENYMQQNGTTPSSSDVSLAITSPQGFYDLSYTQVDSENYELEATAANNSSQEQDTECVTITLISQMDTIYPTFCN